MERGLGVGCRKRNNRFIEATLKRSGSQITRTTLNYVKMRSYLDHKNSNEIEEVTTTVIGDKPKEYLSVEPKLSRGTSLQGHGRTLEPKRVHSYSTYFFPCFSRCGFEINLI
ncbi:hypothetical protein Y032_0555g3377 [Ancylostoma ceylanicum]|uniref:Uncharacterized protein n=1 Tax=Ancylostoma ceylanicum TaxID=53326 RepID=A0A016WQD4_9BILA|nr:hypothetical protein Y032_0555g3377 [Ancylostoma ceylanicum]